jgi:hypothetical protein
MVAPPNENIRTGNGKTSNVINQFA